ncbi:MAG: hypothetical protein J6P18_02530 [Aeriscardovia sp.]|nr:hypothetical protein [Aeriscardovia sp.]
MEESPRNDQSILGELEEIGVSEEVQADGGKKKRKFIWLYIIGAILLLIIALIIYWAVSSHSSYSTPSYKSAITAARQEEANLKGILSSTSSSEEELSKDLPSSSSVQAFSQTWNLANTLVSSLPSYMTKSPQNSQEAQSYTQSLNQWVEQAKNYGYELTQQAQVAGIYGARSLFSTQKANLEATLKKAGSSAPQSLTSEAQKLLGQSQPSSPSAMVNMAEEMKSLSAQLAKE